VRGIRGTGLFAALVNWPRRRTTPPLRRFYVAARKETSPFADAIPNLSWCMWRCWQGGSNGRPPACKVREEVKSKSLFRLRLTTRLHQTISACCSKLLRKVTFQVGISWMASEHQVASCTAQSETLRSLCPSLRAPATNTIATSFNQFWTAGAQASEQHHG
jgi:hypothetical protein